MVLYRHSLRAGLFPARFAVLLLQFQQKLFVFHSAAIAGEAAVLTDHPVAGDKMLMGLLWLAIPTARLASGLPI